MKYVVGLFLVIGSLVSPLSAVDWEPISDQELSIEAPRVDPEADAEAIFWKTWITDHMLGGRQPQTVKEQYLRIKIFTERGVEDQSTIDLISVSGGVKRIQDLRARTIKPDGRIIDLEKNSIFERSAAKAGGVNVKTRAFSMPGVEPGDIIEYQWKESQDNHFAQYTRLYTQREIPAWEVTYFVKPSEIAYNYYRMSMKTQSFNIEFPGFEDAYLGFYSTSIQDVPAFEPEPNMPPEDEVRAWILLFYSKGSEVKQDKYWDSLGKEYHKSLKPFIAADGAIKSKAAELTAGLSTPAEKLATIRNFCLTEIKDIYHDRFGVTAEERDKFKANIKPSQTLKKGMGTYRDINRLFVALLNAAGVEARMGYSAGRDDSFFNPAFLDPYLLTRRHVGVRVDGEWTFHDLGSPYAEPGMLSWQEEGVNSLLLDPKAPEFVVTPFASTERSRVTRKADLTLLEDGTLEGTIERVYLGHYSSSNKRVDDGETDDGRRERWEEIVQNRLSTADIDDIDVLNATDLVKPYTVKYHVKIPGYAQSTGSRMFLQPAYFRMNISPRFQTSERKHDIYFNYPWSEIDEVSITLPEGFVLESPESPASTEIEHVGYYRVKLTVEPGRKLVYKRDFAFGEGGNIIFPATSYQQVKGLFDFIHEQDNHVVTLKRSSE